jgi:hypothetical protein
MKLLWRLTVGSCVVLGLGGLSLHLRPAHGQEVPPPPRAARPPENVDLQVPAGMTLVLTNAPPSRSFRRQGEEIVEGDATIVVGDERTIEGAKQLLKQADRGNALRLSIRHSRVTLRRGQPNYPSQIFIEPLSVGIVRRQ